MGRHELHKLLEQIDLGQTELTHPERQFVRWPYRLGAIELIIELATGARTSMYVATRNISRGGICILHCAYIHPGIRCEVVLHLEGESSQSVPGIIHRCTHACGRVHEVGIEFDEQISTRNLLGLDPLNESYSLECVEPSRLQGEVLIVAQTDIEREILTVMLEDTKLVLNSANNIEDSLTLVSKGCDLIVADYYIGDETGTDLTRQLRGSGLDMPVIIMTSDKSEMRLDEIRDSQASGILSKPITKDRLYQAIAEFLHADGDGGPLYTTLSERDITYSILGKFYIDIKKMTHSLGTALRSDDKNECVDICRTLSGTASPLGFGTISELATIADRQLTQCDTLRGAVPEIRALIAACRRIKADAVTLKAIKRAEAARLKAIEDAKEMRPIY